MCLRWPRGCERTSPTMSKFSTSSSRNEAAALLVLLPLDSSVEILDKPELDFGAEIIEALPRQTATHPARRHVGRHGRRHRAAARGAGPHASCWQRLDAAVARGDRQGLLAYPENTAGAIMTTEFVSVPATWTVGQTLAAHPPGRAHPRNGLRDLCARSRTRTAGQRGDAAPADRRRARRPDPDRSRPPAPVTTSPLTDREDVARLISKYDLLAVPVVDKAGHVLGIVTVDDIIDAIIEESTEDVQKFGGMAGASTSPTCRSASLEMIRKRGGWLCVLFLSEMLTASAMQHFEGELEKAIVLTLFIPLIMSSGGNSGSQATSLLIRALALREVQLGDWWRVALRELPTGLMLGAMLGVIGIVPHRALAEARLLRLRRALDAGRG